jgi:membrane peptidoglycan carboxypeptidase
MFLNQLIRLYPAPRLRASAVNKIARTRIGITVPFSAFLRRIGLAALLAAAAVPAAAEELPPPKLATSSYAVTADGKFLGWFGETHRVPVRDLDQVSHHIIHALIATEDRDFYQHDGVSIRGLSRAVIQTLTGKPQGGSTLTMQLARNLYLTHERTMSRKMNEISIALELEKRYSKNEILRLYLDTMFYGRGAYGIWAASEEYFQKTPDKLTLLESALLVGLLNAPSALDPVNNPQGALARRTEVLHNLVETGRLPAAEFEKIKNRPLGLNLRPRLGGAFLEHARREATALLAAHGKTLADDVFEVTTTLDSRAQVAAEAAVRQQWGELPLPMRTAQAGLVALDVNSGAIRAMVAGNPKAPPGGLNHVTQIQRQAGSTFKPFLYGSLLEQGCTLAERLENVPVVTQPGTEFEWRPSNDDDTVSGPVSMRLAVKQSLNLAAAYAVTELSDPATVVEFAHRCGIQSPLHPWYSIALGTSDVSPLEMAAAYCVFPSGGQTVRPFAVTRIAGRDGGEIPAGSAARTRAVSPETAYLLNYALQTVVNGGTASRIRKVYRGVAAGKTGTAQGLTDAWFVGYDTRLATAIWIGFDNPTLRLIRKFSHGGEVCAPIWGNFMAKLVKTGLTAPTVPFRMPPTLEEVEVCSESGGAATEHCPVTELLPMYPDQAPPPCRLHQEPPPIEDPQPER